MYRAKEYPEEYQEKVEVLEEEYSSEHSKMLRKVERVLDYPGNYVNKNNIVFQYTSDPENLVGLPLHELEEIYTKLKDLYTKHDINYYIGLQAVVQFCEVMELDLYSLMTNRNGFYAEFRGMLMNYFRNQKISLATIGKIFGKHHSSVIHSIDVYNTVYLNSYYKKDVNRYKRYEEIIDTIYNKVVGGTI